MTFTYGEVGATRQPGPLPAGYRHVRRHAEIGRGAGAFRAAAEALATWQVQRGAGLGVRAAADRAAAGVRLAVGIGLGPLRVWAPCELVWVVDEPAEYGWAYGTLPGHPECGEEAWIVSIDAQDRVWCDIRAFSRPATWYARFGGPLTHLIQEKVTDRYVRALTRAAGA
jgi:uncharacterized protein (UPF0548 family)